MKKNANYILITVYALVMLLILTVSVGILLYALSYTQSKTTIQTDTEYIYVYQTEDKNSTSETVEKEEGWLVKEYEGRVGIFQKDGTLLYLLDTHIKTLPEADRRLLEEGIEVKTEAQLNSIIEDYSD